MFDTVDAHAKQMTKPVWYGGIIVKVFCKDRPYLFTLKDVIIRRIEPLIKAWRVEPDVVSDKDYDENIIVNMLRFRVIVDSSISGKELIYNGAHEDPDVMATIITKDMFGDGNATQPSEK